MRKKITSENLDEGERNISDIKIKLHLEATNAYLSAQLQKSSCEMKDLNDRHVDLQSWSMRDTFHGIAETTKIVKTSLVGCAAIFDI